MYICKFYNMYNSKSGILVRISEFELQIKVYVVHTYIRTMGTDVCLRERACVL